MNETTIVNELNGMMSVYLDVKKNTGEPDMKILVNSKGLLRT